MAHTRRRRARPHRDRCGHRRRERGSPAVAHPVPHPHRVRIAEQAGHVGGPRIAAGARRDRADQGRIRMELRSVRHSGGRLPVLRGCDGSGTHRTGGMDGTPGRRGRRGRIEGAKVRLVLRSRDVPSGRSPPRSGLVGRHEEALGRGAAGGRGRSSRTHRRIGRSDTVEQQPDRGFGRLRTVGPVRSEHPVRHPGARHGGDRQRDHASRGDPGVRGDVPDVLRLHAPRRPPRGADGDAVDLAVDPRLRLPR